MPTGYDDSRFASRAEMRLLQLGMFTENIQYQSAGSTLALATGDVRASAVPFLKGEVARTLYCHVTSAAVGGSHAQMALWDTTGVLLANSADAPTALQSTGLIAFALTSPYTIPQSGLYYVGVFQTAVTTQPTLLAGNVTSASQPVSGFPNPVWRMSGQAALPSPATVTTAGGTLWFGVG